MKFSLKNIARKISASAAGETNNTFSSISIDSRSIGVPSETLFVAIKSSRNNGHAYISELYNKGVRCFLVSENQSFHLFSGAGFIVCNNTVNALQTLASYKRSLFKKEVIAITGSNGKTIVKEWLYQLLQSDYTICRSPKSYNSQVGVPLSVWQLDKEHDLAIFEAGISQKGEMEKLEKVIAPDIGIITNIKAAHDENFSSRKEKATEKLKLFVRAKKIFFCSSHKEIASILESKEYSKIKKISWGRKQSDKLRLTSVKKNSGSTTLRAVYKSITVECEIPFTDEGSIENAMHCWLFMLTAGYNVKEVALRMKELSPVAMRLEMKQAVNNSSLVNDSYNSDLESLSVALDFLNRQHQHPKKTVILSDIFQTGKNDKALYTEVAKLIRTKNVDRFIGVGDALIKNRKLFGPLAIFYIDTEELLQTINLSDFSNEAILLKGSRDFGFERISSLLQQKSHDTVLEINLNNVIHNLNYYRNLLKPGTGVMGMVKAFSYGSGSYEIAGALQHHNVNYLAVAYADEGVALRNGGIRLPIMVMNPEPQSFHDLVEYDLEPEIFSPRILQLFAGYISNYRNSKKKFPPIHVKIDTGMHRLGFEEKDIDILVDLLKKNKQLRVATIFSHLAASDEARLNEFTQEQLNSFKNASEKIKSILNYEPLLHICNSAAIKRFPEAHFDLVRLGIGMYGVGADLEEQKHLYNAGTWKTTISQIKHLNAGQTVGYSRKGIVNRPTKIGTIPVGYADGFLRKFSNGKGCVYIKGLKAPVIGNVCMDMCMIDITGIDAEEGDEVIIFNSPETLSELARSGDTIPYEILTSISPRVKRVYLEE